MLIFRMAKSNFTVEWSFAVTIKCWAKKAKCQGIAGGFTVIQMEREELHVLSLTTVKEPPPLSPYRPRSPPHNSGDRERQQASLATGNLEKRPESWRDSSEGPW